ncbi:unnamed protein product [Brachionus calyciflorus]|uniref:Uncharacterized protein n=1 Tax=Brachionus calyciflorus TaxID=104777 RepID=A0A813URV9_9BILA|nr:unnamed protein product [Brachionus calyciflorus]
MFNQLKKQFSIIAISLIILLIFSYKHNDNKNDIIIKVLRHDCDCFRDEFVDLLSNVNKEYFVSQNQKSYSINPKNLFLTCDLYRSLKRGPNQKIISYSLYGKDNRYYNLIPNLTQKVKEFFPDYVMRIYHDNSIDESIKCDLECKNSHVEFCNINNLPLNSENFDKEFNLNYIHSMKWRFLPIGDSFVDVFMSRDLDSMLLKREVDSVHEWIDSEDLGHIMRDHYYHGHYILGGMWGFKNIYNQKLGKEIFDLLVDKSLALKYNPSGDSPYGNDKLFLMDHVYQRINNISTVHDSYSCHIFPNSKPFPTKRLGDCFIGGYDPCNETNSFFSCPLECRPKDHIDWESC